MTIPGALPPWPREELRAAHATIADLRMRLAATERHCTDLQAIVETLRGQLAEVDNIRSLLPDVTTVLDGLPPPVDRPVWQP